MRMSPVNDEEPNIATQKRPFRKKPSIEPLSSHMKSRKSTEKYPSNMVVEVNQFLYLMDKRLQTLDFKLSADLPK